MAEAKTGAKKEEKPSWIWEQVSKLARNIPGYDLLKVVIGRDPISGQEEKRDAVAWTKAIMGIVPGGAALFTSLEEVKVIPKAAAWFQTEISKLNITFAAIKGMFQRAWKALTAVDLLNVSRAVEKIKPIFLAPVDRIKNFVVKAGPKLMEFIFEGAMSLAGAAGKKVTGILGQGKGVLQKIISDPVGFLKNLIDAVRGGLSNFVSHIGVHLQTGLAGWLFGTLGNAGIVLPEKLNLAGIFSLMAQILGVTWQAIRAQVVKRVGPMAEKVMDQIEKSVGWISTLITRGPVALLDMAKEFLGELQALFFDAFIGWLRNTIIVRAVEKLISMFNPVGAIVQAVMTIYNMVQFFIERAKQIASLVNAVFSSIAEIAAGNLKKAVAAVEDSLVKALPVAISFLANLVGIGGITAKIREIIQKIRKPIDEAVGKAVGFIAGKAKRLIARISGADKPKEVLGDTTGKTVKEGKGEVAENAEKLVASPSDIARSWQGTKDYPGVDRYRDITVKKGKVIYRGEPQGTEYFTTKSAIKRSDGDATKLFEGLQVIKNEKYGYRQTAQGYLVKTDIDAAFGITKANPEYGKGGLPQIFIPNANELVKQGVLEPIDGIKLINWK